MAVTRTKAYKPGVILNTSKFTATADNDTLMAAGTVKLVLGAIFHGAHLSALNIDSGADITAYPFTVAATEAVCATSDGTSGDVTIVWCEVPTVATGVGV